MIQIPFLKKRESVLGIDAGTFSTKIIHLSYHKKEKPSLENYGEKFNKLEKKDLYENIRKKTFPISHKEVAEDIKNILIKSKIKEKRAIFSIPDFRTFFTVFKIPFMPKEEMDSAIRYEAKQHIPMPLKNVFLDWSVSEKGNKELKIGPKIILVAIPNEIIGEYQEIAKLAGINLLAIEPEIFSLTRTLNISENNEIIQLIDIGVQSTTLSIIEKDLVKSVFSVNFSESEIIKKLADGLDMNYNEVEEIKNKGGFEKTTNEGKVMCSQLDFLANEAIRIIDNFSRTENKNVNKIVVTGGLSLTSGFKECFKEKIKKEVSIINPFANISYNPAIESNIKKIGPRYAVAVGLALKNFKK